MTMDYYESDSPPPGVAEGESLTVEQAIANLHSQDYSLRYYAAWWIGRFRVKEPAAIAALIAALQEESEQTKIGDYSLLRNAGRSRFYWAANEALGWGLHCGCASARKIAPRATLRLGN